MCSKGSLVGLRTVRRGLLCCLRGIACALLRLSSPRETDLHFASYQPHYNSAGCTVYLLNFPLRDPMCMSRGLCI